ncbi:uncharacterized protein LOC128783294 isoform X1 [Vidua chalybeata]|uniref:uncharacterized protein LOC128783294 isoform X1 n=1 Tax=Vidua chalybeata TaxID=81927 RepID=UPI0023A7A44B|nr:uncharacterized protein LOC128783294 isoform X1 [Vidua chalybeata]
MLNEITILPEGKSVQMRLMADTGADVTIIPQTFVAQILSPVRRLFPEAIILHYMDDVLVCASDSTYLKATLDKTIKAIRVAGLQIAEEKIQFSAPWRYLGFLITGRTVTPQTLTINEDPKTLRELQQLCGTITWIRPLLGLTTEELSPLFCLLRGDGDLASLRELTPAAREALGGVAVALNSRQAHRVVWTLPVNFAVLDAEDDCRLEDTSETSDAPDRHHLAVTGQELDSPTAERKHMGHAGEVLEAGQLLYGHGKCGQSVIHVPAKALGELSHLECWLSKQANATSAAFSDLLADEEVTRHATLQNRAAIDFLLLAHGHGCEDFEGMCCFNLASKSTSIQANIQRIREQVDDLKTETSTVDPVNKLLSQWSVPGWVAIILRGLFWIFLIMFIISLALFLFRRMLLKMLGSAYLINKNGGDVGGGVGEGSLGLPWETAVV